MKHIKKIIIAMIIIGLIAGGIFIIRNHMMNENGEVKIQGFCLGICGKNKDGKGAGIGIGASDKGPLILAGPWGDKNNDDNNDHDEEN